MQKHPGYSPLSFSISISTTTRWLLSVVLIIHLINVAVVLVRYQYFFEHPFFTHFFIPFFWVSSEGILPTFYSVATLMLCGVLLGLIAMAASQQSCEYRWQWCFLSVLFFFLAMDEGFEIHERLSEPIRIALDTRGPLGFAWVIPGAGFVMLLGLIYIRFILTLPVRTRNAFVLSAFVYLSGALGMEIIGSNYRYQYGNTLNYGIIASIEEVFEMLGIVLFIRALLQYMEDTIYQVNVNVVKGAP